MRLELFFRGKRVMALEARLNALEAEMARQASQRAAGLEGLRRALDVAGVDPPEALAAAVERGKLRVLR